jgi:hypothetical protein
VPADDNEFSGLLLYLLQVRGILVTPASSEKDRLEGVSIPREKEQSVGLEKEFNGLPKLNLWMI